ncbi:ROK family transcriptional regulator [Pseudonocardia spinosispora]|uniref:ROK family transcriptional regulator n=1 Tax=Pseudonocardia spinosispora TaxID=103441 RepID=UPI0004167CE9|nr:ROK family transcriptional regulator [Pseudonocardia spinosispora]
MTTYTGDQLDGLVAVLHVIRAGEARTRPELTRATGLGRTVVTQRLGQLLAAGLVEEGALGRSTGGRAPRELRFRAEAGSVLAAELGATAITAGLTDLNGELLAERTEAWDVSLGAEATLGRLEALFDELVDDTLPVWGVGVGLPGPVEFRTGRPVSPPIMPGWDGYPVRDRLTARYRAPAWVDNEVNLMALGELRAGAGRSERDLIYLKMGSGIGAGLVSGGRLHRGAQGCAGDLGHVAVLTGEAPVTCRCGNLNCLEALAGGIALARDGTEAARANRSPFLAGRLTSGRPLTARDVADAAEHGDPVAVELLTRAGRLVGDTLATLVSMFNPAHVVVGGGVAESGDQLLAALRESVYRRSLPLATRELRITRSSLSHRAGLVGAAHMVTDELFSRARLGGWITEGTPATA